MAARENKLGKPKGPTAKTAETLLESILEDVVQTATMPFREWLALGASPLVPLAIPVSQGRQYKATQRGIDAAHELTKLTWLAREDFRQTIKRKEFDTLSFTAIGDAILNCSGRLPADAGSVEATLGDAFFIDLALEYTDALNRAADMARPDVDRHFPCHLFHPDQDVSAFAIGPVEFRPRADWMDRFVTDPAERSHFEKVETGALKLDELRTQAHAPGRPRDLYNAWSVISLLQGFAWVATIRITGHELSQSHDKASTIVGLAIDALGLRFQREDARRFVMAGRNNLHNEDRLATSIDGKFLRGWTVRMAGLGSRPGALIAKMAAEQPFLDAAGRILEAYVKGRQTARAPHLVERWANALFWVGEARREPSDFMAVVNYGCAVDGLCGAGGYSNTMTEFAQAALNPKGEQTPDGSRSIEDVVTTVYREGRNKLAHGEMPGLFEDFFEMRSIADALLVNLFDAVTAELASMIADRPDIFTVSEKNAYRAFRERLQKRP